MNRRSVDWVGVGLYAFLGLLFAAIIGVIIGGVISSSNQPPSIDGDKPVVEEGGEVYHLEWKPVSPPYPGLECWVAAWGAYLRGYAVAWCREGE